MYGLEEFGGGMLVEAIKTHPKILLEGMLIENPWFLNRMPAKN